MSIDPSLSAQGTDWIAEMVSEELGGFVPSEFCDLVFEIEARVREEANDPEMSHDLMAKRLFEIFEADPNIPTQPGAVSEFIIHEVLHWEDEFLAMAGHPRKVRR